MPATVCRRCSPDAHGVHPRGGRGAHRPGFAQRDLQQAILYGLPRPTSPSLPPDVSIERAGPETLQDFVQATAAGFEWPREWRAAAIADLRRRFQPDDFHFLARYEGTAGPHAGRAGWYLMHGCGRTKALAAAPGSTAERVSPVR